MPKPEQPGVDASVEAPFPMRDAFALEVRVNGRILEGEELEERFPADWELDETSSKYLGKLLHLREMAIDQPEIFHRPFELLLMQNAKSTGQLKGVDRQGDRLVLPELKVSIDRVVS